MYTRFEVLYNLEANFANNMQTDQTAPSGFIVFASRIISSLTFVLIVKMFSRLNPLILQKRSKGDLQKY